MMKLDCSFLLFFFSSEISVRISRRSLVLSFFSFHFLFLCFFFSSFSLFVSSPLFCRHSGLYKMKSFPSFFLYLTSCFYINLQSIFKTKCYMARIHLLCISNQFNFVSNYYQKQEDEFKSTYFTLF